MENKDLLQIKIDAAKENLSEETKNAISAVNWRATILSMRERRGYSFSQLEDLEIETELLLYGLIRPEEYQKKLEDQMKITREESSELVNLLNDLIFQKVREELVKATESKKVQVTTEKEAEEGIKIKTPTETQEEKNIKVLDQSGINIVKEEIKTEEKPIIIQEKRDEMLAGVENPESILNKNQPLTQTQAPTQTQVPETPKPSFMAQKLSGSFQIPTTESTHTDTIPAKHSPLGSSKTDPYREAVE
jgi:hypothetical protein